MRPACLALLISVSAAGADREFDRVVKAIESHYGTSRLHIPLMGVANFAVKVGRPAGASGFKIAVFRIWARRASMAMRRTWNGSWTVWRQAACIR